LEYQQQSNLLTRHRSLASRSYPILETSSPYFSPGIVAVNTPAYLGDVAAYVMSDLNHRPAELYRPTLENTKVLFRVESNFMELLKILL
jgi:Tat protein secretion system quality control protein TatD with DNase activity